jgi:hypothetical protein
LGEKSRPVDRGVRDRLRDGDAAALRGEIRLRTRAAARGQLGIINSFELRSYTGKN